MQHLATFPHKIFLQWSLFSRERCCFLSFLLQAALDGSGIKPIHSFVLACYANEYHYYYVCGWVLGDGHKLIQVRSVVQ